MVKKDLNIWLATKMLKKLDPCAYFSQTWMHVEKTLMKLKYIIFNKRWWIISRIQLNLGKS